MNRETRPWPWRRSKGSDRYRRTLYHEKPANHLTSVKNGVLNIEVLYSTELNACDLEACAAGATLISFYLRFKMARVWLKGRLAMIKEKGSNE